MNEREIFAETLQRPKAERSAYLDEVCENDHAMRRRIETLLQQQADLGSFMEHPPLPGALRDLRSEHGTSADVQNATHAIDVIPLDFLQPTDEPDSLGRLGTYEITEVIGRGGMGIVLKGRDNKLNRVAAVKVLAPELAGNATARKRFRRESQATAAVSHDHVVTIYAVEDAEPPYLVMEYIDGPSLQQKIDAQGTMEVKEILRIGRQVALGLAAAHEQGLIHRDVKPSNILLQNGVERAQITDFGLARAVDDVDITRTGQITGTPHYMSPEQAQGLTVDARSDLFSLGCVLYAMSTGRSPFRAETTIASIRRVCDETPRPIREVNPDIPDWLAGIIERLLAKNPDDRFQTALEVSQLLDRHLAHVQNPESCPLPELQRKPHAARDKPWRRWLVAVGAMLAMFVGLGVTEATGVTDLTGTVIRIVTGEGTLVIEVEDPTVQVSLDGEKLSISGAGIEKLSLKPGQYKLTTYRDGQPIREELVTVSRGGRQVIRVSLERPQETVKTTEGIAEIRRFTEYDGDIWSVAITPDSRYVLCTGKRSQDVPAVEYAAFVFERESGRRMHTLLPAPIFIVTVAPNSRVAALGAYDGRIILYNIASGRMLGTLVGHTEEVWSMHFSSDGSRLLSGSADETVRLWNVNDHRELAQLKYGAIASTVHLLPDGEQAVLFSNSWDEGTPDLAVWNLKTGQQLRQLAERESKGHSIDVTADGRKVLLAYSEWSPGHLKNILTLLDVSTGEVVQTYRGAVASPGECAITRDGRTIICGGRDQALRMWDAQTGEQLHKTELQNYMPLKLAVSADGRYAVSGGGESQDRSVRLWRLPETGSQTAEKKNAEQAQRDLERAEALLREGESQLVRYPAKAEIPLRKAVDLCERLADEFPDNADFRRRRDWYRLRLAQSLMFQAMELTNENRALAPADAARALELALGAVELLPDDKGVLTTVAQVYYRRGEWEHALEYCRKSEKSRIPSGIGRDYLACRNQFRMAMVYWQLNRQDEARKMYQTAVAWLEANKPKDSFLQADRREFEALLGNKAETDGE